MNPRDFALDMIRRNPAIANNPNSMHMVDVMQRGDAEEGMKIAENLCRTYGVTPQQAMEQARRFFGIQ